MRTWVLRLMCALAAVGSAAALAILMAIAREQRAKSAGFWTSKTWARIVLQCSVFLFGVWFNLYVFAEPFRRRWDEMTGWTSW